MSKAEVTTIVPPVTKAITVPWNQAEAFRRFTQGMGKWWPTRTHSVARSENVDVVFEAREGGLVYEQNGERSVWAEVVLWEPSERFILNWHPGRDAATGGPLEVRFIAGGDSCRIELTHGGWEKLGDKALETRTLYDSGWDFVLNRYLSE